MNHPSPRRRTLWLTPPLLALVAATSLLSACGEGPDAADEGLFGGPPGRTFADATSTSCSNVSGAAALYWDFMNGITRADYPETYRLIPYAPGTPFFHPQQPLYNFIYPSSWSAETLTDPASQLMGVNVVRPDGQAVWRRLNFTLIGAFTANDVVAEETNQMVRILGITEAVQTVCFIALPDETRAALLLTAGDFTANVTAQTFQAPYLGGTTTTVFVQLAVAPTAEYDDTVVGVFFPLSGQMLLGGSSKSECNDGVDNDGDGKVDFPEDPGCSSSADDSEAG